MTNRDAIARAISGGLADKNMLLTQILAGDATLKAPHKSTQWKHAAGWVCTACMLCFILFGYFNGNITFSAFVKQDLDLIGENAGAASSEAKSPELSDESEPPQAAPQQIQEDQPSPATPSAAPPQAKQALPEPPAQSDDDGWVHTNQEVKSSEAPDEPKFETDTSDSDSNNPPSKPTRPSKPVPDGGGSSDGDSNPDTGGGGDLFVIPYLSFTTDAAYNSYWGYIPRDLLGYLYFPFVNYTPPDKLNPGWAEFTYGNPNGVTKQIFCITVKGNAQKEPQITSAAQITESLLKTLDKDDLPNDPQDIFISVNLNIQNRVVAFESQNVTYLEAVQVLQSLPALNGGIAP